MPAEVVMYSPEDKEAVVRILADSFATDPVSFGLYGDEVLRPLEVFFDVVVDIRGGETHVLKDEGKVVGAVVWGNESHGYQEDISIFKLETRTLGLWSAICSAYQCSYSLQSVLDTFDIHHGDRAYLKFIGIAPGQQGKGYGSTLLNESCKLMAATRTPCTGFYLESSNLRNVPFYERCGFVSKEEKSWKGYALTAMVRDIVE